jgi:hypothetical protein
MDGRVRVGGIQGGTYRVVLLRGDGMRAGKGEVVSITVTKCGIGVDGMRCNPCMHTRLNRHKEN